MAWQQLSSYNPTTGFSLNEEELADINDILQTQIVRRDGTKSMLANLNINGFVINGVADPVANTDGTNKRYVDLKANTGGDSFTGNINMNFNFINNVGNATTTYQATNKLYVDNANIALKGYVDTANLAMKGYVDNSNIGLKNYTDTQLNTKLNLSGGTMTGTLVMNSQILRGNPQIITQGPSVGEGMICFYNTAHGVGRFGTSADVILYTTSGVLDLSTQTLTRGQFRLTNTQLNVNVNLDMYGRIFGNVAYIDMSPSRRIISANTNLPVIISGLNDTFSGGIAFGNPAHGICRGSTLQGTNNDIVVYTTAGNVFLSPAGNSTAYFDLGTTLLNCKVDFTANNIDVKQGLIRSNGNLVANIFGSQLFIYNTINATGKVISNIANPSASSDAASKSYVDSTVGSYVPYTGATATVNLNARSITNAENVTVNKFLGFTPFTPILTSASSFYMNTSDKIVFTDSTGFSSNLCTDSGFTTAGDITIQNTYKLSTNNIRQLAAVGLLTIDDHLGSNYLTFNYNAGSKLVQTGSPLFLASGYGYNSVATLASTISAANNGGTIDRGISSISIDNATTSKFLSSFTISGTMLNGQQILLFNNTSYIICLGHKSVTSAGYLLGRYQQLHPRQRVMLCWYATDSCFSVIGLDTALNKWNIFAVRENEFKGFCHTNGTAFRAGINFNNAASPINGYAFSTANAVTLTGTNWVVAYSVAGGFLAADGNGDQAAEAELYKTRFFHVGYGVNTFTINNLTRGEYYMVCVHQNVWDGVGTIRNTRNDHADTNTRITFDYQTFYNFSGYTFAPSCISYFIFRSVFGGSFIFTVTNIVNSHLYAVWVIGLGTSL